MIRIKLLLLLLFAKGGLLFSNGWAKILTSHLYIQECLTGNMDETMCQKNATNFEGENKQPDQLRFENQGEPKDVATVRVQQKLRYARKRTLDERQAQNRAYLIHRHLIR